MVILIVYLALAACMEPQTTSASGMIKQRRTDLGLSQRALAKRVGVSDAYITQLETRERINPSLHVLKSLAKALKVTVAELVE